MKRFLIFAFVFAGCAHEIMDVMEIMGGPKRSIPRLMDGLSDGRAVVYFSDGYTHEVKLIDPGTGQGQALNIGGGKDPVMAIRVGWGDTIFVITMEESHKKLHKFTPDGLPRGKHVLKPGASIIDFLVTRGDYPEGAQIVTLNFAGPLCTAYDKTGKLLGSGGPITSEEGPYINAWISLVQSMSMLLVVPRRLKGECGDCNYVSGPIQVYRWGETGNTTGEVLPFLKEISLDRLFEDWDGVKVMAVSQTGDEASYVFVHLVDYDEKAERTRTGHALVKVDPTTDPGKYEIVKFSEYEELFWKEDGKRYDKEGNYRPVITCAAVKNNKLFLAYADGHVEVCEIGD